MQLSSSSTEQSIQQTTTLLHLLLERWADRSLLLLSSLEQVVSRSILIVGCIGRLRYLGMQSPTARQLTYDALRTGRTSAAFNDGVATYLDYPTADVRRAGLVCAEVLVGLKVELAPDSQSEPALDFGPEVWDGKGNGKEEARVIRTCALSWLSDTEVRKLLGPNPGYELSIPPEQAEDPTSESNFDSEPQAVVPNTVIQGGTLGPVGTDSDQESDSDLQLSLNPRQKRPSPTRLRLGTAPRSHPPGRSLIQSLDSGSESDGDAQLRRSSSERKPTCRRKPRQVKGFAQIVPSSESEGDESSSGDDALPDLGSLGLDGLGLDGSQSKVQPTFSEAKGMSTDQAAKKRDELSYRMPRGRIRAPVYIHELVPLLRADKRSSVRMALHTLPALVRAKSHFGSEVSENAAELVQVLSMLDNTYEIQLFDPYLCAALVALAVASPSIAALTMVECLFGTHLSLARKQLMVACLTYAALELAGELPSVSAPSETDEGGQQQQQEKNPIPERVSQYVNALLNDGIQQAKEQGTSHVPALQRQQALQFTSTGKPQSKSVSRDQAIAHAATHAGIVRAPAQQPQQWAHMGVPNFAAPLLARILAHLGVVHGSNGGWFARHAAGNGGSNSMVGAAGTQGGWPIAAMHPLLLPALIEACTALLHATRSLAPWESSLLPAALELSLTASRTAMTSLAPQRSLAIRLAATELVLVVLSDLSVAAAQRVLATQATLVAAVAEDAEDLFGQPGADASTTAVAAAVQLRLAELTKAWHETGSLLSLES